MGVDVRAGEAIATQAGERVRYSTPGEGAEYIAVCLPAFSPETVNRDELRCLRDDGEVYTATSIRR